MTILITSRENTKDYVAYYNVQRFQIKDTCIYFMSHQKEMKCYDLEKVNVEVES